MNYKVCADDDYKYFKAAVNAGIRGNRMGAEAQEICEKYLKHIIDKYLVPQNDDEQKDKERLLRTHNLQNLINALTAVGIVITPEQESAMIRINGYYFTTRYPGDDAYTMTEKDVEACVAAIDSAKEFVESFESKLAAGDDEK